MRAWLEGPIDEGSKEEIRALQKKDPKALADAFFTDLDFGTGGLRGLMGVGTNRLNIYTIRLSTQGLANYILKQEAPHRVAICYDSRHNSRLFAEESARVLAANGIEVLLSKDLRPTPFASFVVRREKCLCGIMITASHNPAAYNGYKVYWSDGAQVVPPHDVGIMAEIEKIKSFTDVKLTDLESSLIKPLNEKLDQAYIDAIRPLQFFPEQNRTHGKELKICYTSLHGTGITLVPKALANWGFPDISYVQEQIKPDGDFPTVKFPNPEFKEALALGIEKMKETASDILIANDPDADRTGLVVLHKNQPVILTGNEIGALSVHFICETLREKKNIPPKAAFVTTIVSTELIKAIAAAYGITCALVLTGFKYIAEKIRQWEESPNSPQFLFGAEESYGYLLGTVVRDKDAIIASCLLAEMALDAKLQQQTLVDRLHALYTRFGLFQEKQYSVTFSSGQEEETKIKAIMGNLRKEPPAQIAGKKVVQVEDYLNGIQGLPKSDVLLFRLADESKLILRPSGTEPKIKLYCSVRLKTFPSIEEGMALCEKNLTALIEGFKQSAKL